MAMTPKELRDYLIKEGEVNTEALCTYLSALEDEMDEIRAMFRNHP